MQVGDTAAISTALRKLATRAGELTSVELPTLFGGVVDRTGAGAAVQRALSSAETAAELLGRAEFGAESITAARQAVYVLEHTALNEVAMRESARRVANLVTRIEESTGLGVTAALSKLDGPLDQLDLSDWGKLARAAGDGSLQERSGIVETLAGVRPSSAVLDELAAGSTTPFDELSTYLAHADVQRTDVAARAAQADELLLRDTIDLADQARLASLLESVHGDFAGDLAARLRSAAASGTVVDGSERVAASVDLLGADGRQTLATRLLQRSSDELSTSDWRRLARLLDDDALATKLGVSRTLAETKPLKQIARDVAAGKYRPSAKTQRYFERFQLDQLGEQGRIDAASTMLHGQASELTDRDWQRLARLLDYDGMHSKLGIPTELPNTKPLKQIAREIGAGRYRPSAKTERYFLRHQLAQLDDAGRIDAASQLLTRRADDLSADEWTRLATLLEIDGMHASLGIPRQLPDTKPLAQIAREVGAGDYRPSAKTQVYFERFQLASIGEEGLIHQAHQLLSRPSSELSTDDWTRLSAILDIDGMHAKLGIPKELPNTKPLRQIASEVAAGKYRPTGKTQAYFARHQLSQLGEQGRIDAASELLGRSADDLTSDEWARLAALLDFDGMHDSLGVAKELRQTKPLRQIASDVASGKYRPGVKTKAYFAQHRFDRLDDVGRRELVADIFNTPVPDVTSEQWTTLAAVLEHKAGAKLVGLPDELPNTKPLRQIAIEVANGDYRPTGKTAAYFTMWRTDNDPAYIARVESAVDAVIAGTADSTQTALVAEQWHRLDSIVANRAPEDQLALATAVLQADGNASTRNVRGTLEAIRDSLGDGADLEPALRKLHEQTRELVDRNLSRLAGRTPQGAVKGYSNHPDYAEIGRIRANLQLLESMRANPAAAAVESADAAGSAAAVQTGEALDW